MTLAKAKLIDVEYQSSENHENHIDFMFNPNELSFSRSISLEQPQGASTNTGEPKTSFKHPNPYSLTISNIVLDTYEDQVSVRPYIRKFARGVEFMQDGEEANKRPPIYLFTWGANEYLRCFVKTLSFKLTLFLPDGTPVRALVDLTLEQVDEPTPRPGQSAPALSAAQRAASGRERFI
ncbi:MAG: hypothetical protein VKJ64_21620 [Leptolyngbyaceae bacterium]|nr:hypothetical protein [Leptolyngbyaceae bacterium]